MKELVINVEDIRTDGGTQQRELCDRTVESYRNLMDEGAVFPAVQTVFDGKEHWLWDGHHRVAAVKLLGWEQIRVVASQGNMRDAMWLSFSANKDHGLPRPQGAAKTMLLKILTDPEWQTRPDEDIASHVGITRRYLLMVRKELSGQNDSKPVNTSQVKTNKTESTEKPTEVTAPPAEVLTDRTGREVPDNLKDIFSRSNEIGCLISPLQSVERSVKEYLKSEDELFRYFHFNGFESAMSNVKRILRFSIPFAVCRICGGDGNDGRCEACSGCGWINQSLYDATPEELK